MSFAIVCAAIIISGALDKTPMSDSTGKVILWILLICLILDVCRLAKG